MILSANWNTFHERLTTLVENGFEIHKSNNRIRTEEELAELKKQVNNWTQEVQICLTESFDEDISEFANDFRTSRNQGYQIPGRQKSIHDYIKEELENLNGKAKTLQYWLKMIGISDAVIRPNEINLDDRKNLDTDEILEILLDKLYELYDDYYHSITAILEGNGVQLKRYNEERELAKTLENLGYVKLVYTRNVTAQLTIEGKRYVEQKRKAQSTDYSKINNTEEELNQKVDDIIKYLEKLGYGQEILFDELHDLKNLYPKLSKKNWGEVLKGKLIDLGLAKVLTPELMNSIFKELTDQVLKLK